MNNSNFQTLGEFIIDKQEDFSLSTGEFTRLLSAIRLAAKLVNKEVNKAGIANIIGAMGSENIQGENQQKLDVLANDIFINALTQRDVVCGIASEENDDFIIINNKKQDHQSKYVVLMDPLDGSSNIDVNVSVGTIFSIYKRISPVGSPVILEDFLQPGTEQVAAGYIIYGSSTMLVYTTGNGVNGFTLDPEIGTFYLSHPNMKIPEKGSIYSINEGNSKSFSPGITAYLEHCKSSENKKPYSARYIGSLVSDFHRNMIKGGIYMYPATESSPKGKLRLLYECNPIAFLCEQSGGIATDGTNRIMEIIPSELHQRVPVFCGCSGMVKDVMQLMEIHDNA